MKTLLFALLLASLTLQFTSIAGATQTVEPSSTVPDSYYAQTDYTPVTQADTSHSERSHEKVKASSQTCTGYYVAFAERGEWGGWQQLDSPQSAIDYQHQLESVGWDSTLAFTDSYRC